MVARLAAGEITYEQAQQSLDGLVVEHGGRLWTMGANSGAWYVYDGRGWVQATPPAPGGSHVAPPPRTLAPLRPREPEVRTRRGGFGKIALVAGVAVVAVVLIAAPWVVLRFARDATRATDMVSPSETGTAASPTTPPRIDGQGFVDYPFARCEPADLPAVIALTTKTALVICGYATEVAYYRAERLNGGGRIELADAVPSSDGYDVTDPKDGTRHEVRPHGLTTVLPDGRVLSEPMAYYYAPA